MMNVIRYNSMHLSILKNLEMKVDALKRKNDETPIQGSQEWLDFRRNGVGGSEVASLLKMGGWSNPKKIAEDKTGLTRNKFGFNFIACNWGTVMENVTIQITELLLNTTVHEINILKGEIIGQLYSPDGIGIVKLICDKQGQHPRIKYKSNTEYFYTLFEFKAPFSALLTGSIPKHYVPQVQDGLSVIKDADNAIFISAQYRICSLSEMKVDDVYNNRFHYFDKKKNKGKGWLPSPHPIAIGLIVVYQSMADKKFYRDLDDEYNKDKMDFDFNDINSYLDDDSDEILNSDSECSESEDEEPLDELNTGIRLSRRKIDFGSKRTPNDQIGRVFSLLASSRRPDAHRSIQAAYIEPFIVKEYLSRIPFLYNQNCHVPDPDKIDNDEINKKIKEYFAFEKIQKAEELTASSNVIIGYIPYKMVGCDIILEERDITFEAKLKPALANIMGIINEINAESDEDEKRKILDESF